MSSFGVESAVMNATACVLSLADDDVALSTVILFNLCCAAVIASDHSRMSQFNTPVGPASCGACLRTSSTRSIAPLVRACGSLALYTVVVVFVVTVFSMDTRACRCVQCCQLGHAFVVHPSSAHVRHWYGTPIASDMKSASITRCLCSPSRACVRPQ